MFLHDFPRGDKVFRTHSCLSVLLYSQYTFGPSTDNSDSSAAMIRWYPEY